MFMTDGAVDEPPKTRPPCGNFALKLNSNPVYTFLMFESLVSTFATAATTAGEIGSYIVIALPSIGLKTVTGPYFGLETDAGPVIVPGRRVLFRSRMFLA